MGENQTNASTDKHFDIYHDLVISASVANVFEAVSQPEQLVNWWPLKCTGTPAVGETYNFYFAPDYDWLGKVIKYAKNETFHIKMIKSDSDWNPTSFGFDLEETDGKVLLKFWHKDWPACNEHYRRSSFCWAILLKGLKNYVEKGEILPFTERE